MSSLYTKLFLKKKEENRWLFLIAFIVVLFTAVIFIFFPIKKSVKLKASDIEFVTFSNLSPSQISIIWKTREAKRSSVFFGESPDRLVRESEDELQVILNKSDVYHYTTLRGLQPDKEYYFVIKIEEKLIGKGGVPFRIKTPPQFLPSQKPPLLGKIVNEKGEPESGKIINLEIEGAFPLSTITGEKGEWVIPLGLVFDEKGKKKIELSGKENFELKVLGTDLIARGSLSAFMDYSLPLRIGKEYVFKTDEEKGVVKKKVKSFKKYEVLLIYPKQGATISSARPLIKGKGVPYEEVLVEIESKKRIVLKTTVDENGDWQVSLPDKLSPGRHIIKIMTKDNEGKSIEIVRDFYIAKSGESVLSAATASANLTTTPEPTPTPTNPPVPTSPPTSAPTPTLIPTERIVLDSTQEMPISGFDPKFIFILSALFLVPGALLLLK